MMRNSSANAVSESRVNSRWIAPKLHTLRKFPVRFLMATLIAAPLAGLLNHSPALAADPALGGAIEVKVQTGALPDKMFQFIPSTIEFKAGTLYKLVLNNPGPNRHSFSSKQFAASVKTLKVQTTAKGVVKVSASPDLQVIELPPETQVEWWLIPQKSAEFTDLHCTVPGHEETGMGGTIVVK
jgi:uncharacterized cupredoxin-like copper-binding protein